MLFEVFYGKLQRAKYASIAKCLEDTALRDLTDLVEKGILPQEGAGRGTLYLLAT
jgi:Fic family protein